VRRTRRCRSERSNSGATQWLQPIQLHLNDLRARRHAVHAQQADVNRAIRQLLDLPAELALARSLALRRLRDAARLRHEAETLLAPAGRDGAFRLDEAFSYRFAGPA
jgi:hypothetical protein